METPVAALNPWPFSHLCDVRQTFAPAKYAVLRMAQRRRASKPGR